MNDAESDEIDGADKPELQPELSADAPGKINSDGCGKRKAKKEEKPFTKVVIRRLPPSMDEETFFQAVSPLPDHDHFEYVKSDLSLGPHSFSRCYVNFINPEDVFPFTETFDQYVFLGAKGQEYPAIVEYAPFQRIPRAKPKKKDPLAGTIDSDPAFIAFKKLLEEEAERNAKAPAGGAGIQSYVETEPTPNEASESTPLLDFLKQKKVEKAKIREEKREERKRKEVERKMKQLSMKEKKSESHKENAEEDENIPPVHVLQSKDRKDGKRESEKADFDRKTEEKDRNQRFNNKKEDRGFKENKISPRSKDTKNKSGSRHYSEDKGRKKEERKKDSREEAGKHLGKTDEAREDMSRTGEVPAVRDGGGGDSGSSNKRRSRGEKSKSNSIKERERKRLNDFMAKKHSKKGSCEENAEKMNSELHRDTSKGLPNREEQASGCSNANLKRRSSLESGEWKKADESFNEKRRNSADAGNSKNVTKENPRTESAEARCTEQPRKSPRESKKHGREESKGEKTKDPRSDRRIRNKDRPSIQIYRPGMGKFSKQRLEKEKAHGSSTEIESPARSPSPTPKSNLKFSNEQS